MMEVTVTVTEAMPVNRGRGRECGEQEEVTEARATTNNLFGPYLAL